MMNPVWKLFAMGYMEDTLRKVIHDAVLLVVGIVGIVVVIYIVDFWSRWKSVRGRD